MVDIIGDRILLGGWIIYPDGEKLMAITPAGVHVQFELIDYTNILGVQPTTPPDYVPPTTPPAASIGTGSQGYHSGS